MNLKLGSKGRPVEILQEALNQLGSFLKVDGEFGEKTRAAVIGYQKKNDLAPDGIVGDLTWLSLGVKPVAEAPAPAKPEEPIHKMTTRAAAIKRYGAIDFASKQWPDKSKWMAMLEVPKDWFPHWCVLDSTHPVEAIYCNKDMHKPLLLALTAVHEAGLGELLLTFDGCFNIRMVRGTNASPSAHAYGLAIDLNAARNGLGKTSGGFFGQPKFVKCFTDQGFTWGGNFHGRKDPMHFSYCWEG